MTITIFIKKACIRWRVGHKNSSEIFKMKRVRSQDSLEMIVRDIFPSQYQLQLNLTKCKTIKKSQFHFNHWNFDGSYSITISVRRPHFRCKCCKIQSKIPSEKGQFSIVVASMLFSIHFSHPMVTPWFNKFALVNQFRSSRNFEPWTDRIFLLT